MKTATYLPDAMLVAAKRHAAEHGMTLREVNEKNLLRTLAGKAFAHAFKLRDASVGGKRLTIAACAMSPSALRELANVRHPVLAGRPSRPGR